MAPPRLSLAYNRRPVKTPALTTKPPLLKNLDGGGGVFVVVVGVSLLLCWELGVDGRELVVVVES